MGSGYTGFIPVMSMLESGIMGNVMDVGFILARMAVSMWGSSSGVSSMVLVITISEMGTHMLVSILQIRCMVLGSISLATNIGIKVRGTREGGKVLVFKLSETEKPNPVIGRMGYLVQKVVVQYLLMAYAASHCYPGSPPVISKSKVLNAVQETQGAAERVYNVGQIDERVNKTVAAANKAANAARVAAVKAVHVQK